MIEKIKYRVSKVLPLVYDDALSYYEVLSKLITVVNDCIDACNENESAIDDLSTRTTTAENNISNIADAIGIINVKIAQLEAAVAAIPTYTAGRGIAITNNAISVMGNDVPLDIHDWYADWSTGGEYTVTDEAAISWILNGGALRNENGVILELVNVGQTFYTYVGSFDGVSYRLRYNINTGLTTLSILS